MAARGQKLLLAVVASAVAAFAAVWVARALRSKEDLEFVRGDGGWPALASSALSRSPTAASAADTRGASALEVREPIFPPSTFRRFYLTPEEVGRSMGQRDVRLEFDPYTYFKYKPAIDHEFDWDEHPRGKWHLRTNSLGLREDDELLEGHPDLRVLVAGDSHTDGVCDNAESYSNVLEARLRAARPGQAIEVLNAGEASYSFYNYLGTLERFLALEPDVLIVGVYGGNDFEEALTLFHDFQGSERPPGLSLYGTRVEQAMEVHRPCVGQAFNQALYFAMHPDQVEVALQMARDVTTEILATCRRFGVVPIFVYIPPFDFDANMHEHQATIAEVLRVLELKPEDVKVAERLADSYLAFLRAQRVDVLDMRAVYRQRGENVYWVRDHHTNVAGERAIGESLLPLVEAAWPATRARVRRAPGAAPVADARARFALLSPGAPDPDGPTIALRELPRDPLESPWKLEFPSSYTLPALDAAQVARCFTLRSTQRFEPAGWFRYESHLDAANGGALTTNSWGLRGPSEPAASAPDLRVLVLGDEQLVDGVQPDETLAVLLARSLRDRHPRSDVECLDATCEGYGLHNHLGLLERCLALEPQVVVMAVQGGNDFVEALRVERCAGREPTGGDAVMPAGDLAAGAAFGASLAHFHEQPEDMRGATRVAVALTRAIRERCRAAGADLIVVYVPPACDVAAPEDAAALAGVLEPLALSDKDRRAISRVAANYLSYLRQGSIEVLDLTLIFEQLPGPHYDAAWRSNARAQREMADFLTLAIEHRRAGLRE